jgi:alpha-galactosidase
MKKLLLALALIAAAPSPAAAATLARTPPMGWNSWYTYRCAPTEQGVLANAQALLDTGMAARGYRYVNVDGCWEARHRTRHGILQADPKAFPGGMAALGRKIHAMGLKLGIYTSAGPTICMHPQPGSYRHYKQDLRTFAAWKVDYVKVDWCSSPPHTTQQRAYNAVHEAARKAGRRMIVAVSTAGTRKPWRWARRYGQTWRIGTDANGRWDGITRSLDIDAPLWRWAGPGGWNDPDMLQVGSAALSPAEARAHFSLWAMLAAPLLEGHDLTSLSPDSLATLTNEEVIALDQDPSGHQAERVRRKNGIETWVKPLAGGDRAVLLLNRRTQPQRLTVRLGNLPGVQQGASKFTVRDLWTHASRKAAAGDPQRVDLNGHEAVVWRLTPRR